MFWRRLFTNQFTKDFFISGMFLFAMYGITHNPLVRPIPIPIQGNWSIQFMQHPLVFGFAGHNYLLLRDGDGKVVSELHGLATDTSTGEWKYVGTKATDELRVWEFDGSKYLAEKSFPGVTLEQGNEETIKRIWELGEKCKDSINTEHIPYPPYGFSFRSETTNSNSVAFTLAHCMNLDTRHIGIWTPGDAMNLLTR